MLVSIQIKIELSVLTVNEGYVHQHPIFQDQNIVMKWLSLWESSFIKCKPNRRYSKIKSELLKIKPNINLTKKLKKTMNFYKNIKFFMKSYKPECKSKDKKQILAKENSKKEDLFMKGKL